MKKISDLLNPQLDKQLRLLDKMTKSARSRLPQAVAAHCWVGGYEKDYLSLVTDHPNYTIYLRCHQREILKQLKEEFPDQLQANIRKVRVRVSRIAEAKHLT